MPTLPNITAAKSSSAAGGIAIVLIWAASLAGFPIPADVAVSIAVGLMWAAGALAHRFGVKVPVEPPKPADGA